VVVYNIIARPDIRYAHAGQIGRPLRGEALAELLSDLIIHEAPSEDRMGQFVMELGLDRESPEAALEDIAWACRFLGFSIVEATVSEYADEAAQQAVLYALGGGVIGGTTTENSTVALVASVVGGIVGYLAGSQVRKLMRRYEARPLRFGWHLRELALLSGDAQGVRPSLV
jgi:hypothetical protein